MAKTRKYDVEAALVARLLAALGVDDASLSDPMQTYGRETGADVEVRLGTLRIGAQVTEFHGDDGPRGSAIRQQEEADARRNIVTGGWIQPVPQAGLIRRVREKAVKAGAHTFEEFAEVWLLVAASIPKLGAVRATFLLPWLLSSRQLEQDLGDELRESKYDRAFIHVDLGATLFEWSRSAGWRCVHGSDNGGQRMGETKWLVGCLQNGPLHDAGVRWFVTERGAGGLRAIAYTHDLEDADRIVAALEAANG
jgi:hypothetical protein